MFKNIAVQHVSIYLIYKCQTLFCEEYKARVITNINLKNINYYCHNVSKNIKQFKFLNSSFKNLFS